MNTEDMWGAVWNDHRRKHAPAPYLVISTDEAFRYTEWADTMLEAERIKKMLEERGHGAKIHYSGR